MYGYSKQTKYGAPQEFLAIVIPRDYRFDRIKMLRLTLKWNYTNRTVDMSMPKYVPAALHKLQHKAPEKPKESSHR